MITKLYWTVVFSLEVVENYTYWYNDYEVTPAGKAIYVIIGIILAPAMLGLDLILSPIELVFYLLTKHYEKEVK